MQCIASGKILTSRIPESIHTDFADLASKTRGKNTN
uniref:Uncharacterized protein n=1 Tax=Arundo donax TaxID=35708 RepID=A0A0A9DAT4_ARUDO